MKTSQAWDPALYNAKARFVSDLASDLVELLAPRPGEAILDLGCGTGDLAALIAGRGAHVTGVDASSEMIRAARVKVPHATFDVADGQALTFDSAFDAVFSNAALHWMLRAEDAARGIARALKPGGRLVAEFGGHGCVATVCAAAARQLVEIGEDPNPWFSCWYFPRIGEYASLLESVGLETRFACLFERPTRTDLADWLRVFRAPLAAHLGARWEPWVRSVEDACRAELHDADGWTLDYVRIRVIARKLTVDTLPQ